MEFNMNNVTIMSIWSAYLVLEIPFKPHTTIPTDDAWHFAGNITNIWLHRFRSCKWASMESATESVQ